MAKNINEWDEKTKDQIAEAFILDLPTDGTFPQNSGRINEYSHRK